MKKGDIVSFRFPFSLSVNMIKPMPLILIYYQSNIETYFYFEIINKKNNLLNLKLLPNNLKLEYDFTKIYRLHYLNFRKIKPPKYLK